MHHMRMCGSVHGRRHERDALLHTALPVAPAGYARAVCYVRLRSASFIYFSLRSIIHTVTDTLLNLLVAQN